MSLASLNSEALQLLILGELDKADINDTRQLQLGGGQVAGADGESQLAIKGALDSLVAREVSDGVVGYRAGCFLGDCTNRAPPTQLNGTEL